MNIYNLSISISDIDDKEFEKLLESNVVSVRNDIKTNGKNSQCSLFISAKKGDVFYLNRSGSIELIGMFVDERPLRSIIQKNSDWVDRSFKVLSKPVSKKAFSIALNKTWLPKDSSEFIMIPNTDYSEFENLILQPVFKVSLADIESLQKEELINTELSIEDCLNLQKKFKKFKNDENYLLEHVNSISNVELLKIAYRYRGRGDLEKQPVVNLRYQLLMILLTKNKLSIELINQLKDDIASKFEKNVFLSWKHPFRILYTFMYGEFKLKLINCFEKLILKLQTELNIKENTNFNLVHLDGAQNQGNKEIWFAIYNNSHSSQKTAKQLFFKVEDKFVYGLLYKPDPSVDTIQTKKNFDYEHLLSVFEQHKELILNDVAEQHKEIIQDDNPDKNIMKKNISLNQILFGPPGTGKTYRLQHDYFPNFTSTVDSTTVEQYFTELVQGLSWWQVLGIALIESNNSKVKELVENRWVQKKAELSESKNVRATVWGTLQMHTVNESKTVNYTKRQPPLIFDKNQDKSWKIYESEAKEFSPELFEHLDSVENYKSNPSKVIKRYEFITFHQSYAYEDFIEGIKPVMGDEFDDQSDLKYEIKPGIFKTICKRAESDPDNNYCLFIDEINRGNVSQIFGELITLIEEDKRKGAKNPLTSVLPYSRKNFSVPKNLYIIGTMNTADRSVEALDSALRRRFSFTEMPPIPKLIKQSDELDKLDIDLRNILEVINSRIEVLLDKDHLIGHSYFMKVESLFDLRNAFYNEIIPLLQEYFFGDYGKITMVLGEGFCQVKNDANQVKFAVDSNNDDIPDYSDKLVYKINNDLTDEKFIDAINIKLLNNSSD